ncbi:Protein CLP1-like protein [Aphelenchoides fujianensis]|nr:Protein CLP1-like protein [Aphelenchoides fujianensis]
MAAEVQVKEHQLNRGQELRFEVGNVAEDAKKPMIQLIEGQAEMFGMPLKKYTKYASFPPGFRGAIYTHTSARIEVTGVLEIEYIATKNQPMLAYVNVHAGITELREKTADGQSGPVVMITGPKCVGKSTLCKVLCNYAVRATTPVVFVDLDVGQNTVMPGCISMVGVEHLADFVNEIDTRAPFAYCFGHYNPMENQKLYDLQVTKAAAVLKKKLQTERFRKGGAIIDTCAWNKGDYYDSVVKAAKEFGVHVVIVLDHERMVADLTRDLPESIRIVHLPKSGGVESLSALQEAEARKLTVHRYFYGTRMCRYYPITIDLPFGGENSELPRIARIGVEALPASCLPFGMDPSEHQTMVEVVPYTPALNNRIVAFIEDVKPLSSVVIGYRVIGFMLIKRVDMEAKRADVLLTAEPPVKSGLALLTETLFMDDIMHHY